MISALVARLQDGAGTDAVRADLTSTVHRAPGAWARVTLVWPDALMTSLAGGREGGPAALFRPGGSRC
jgi:hypothetical protein